MKIFPVLFYVSFVNEENSSQKKKLLAKSLKKLKK